MSQETDYYLARGRSLAAIEQYEIAHKAYYKAVFEALAEAGIEVGGRHLWYSSGGLFGGWHVEQGTEVPAALRRDRKQPGCCVPDRKTAAGKVLHAKLKALYNDGPGSYKLCIALCGEPWCWTGVHEGAGQRMATYGHEKLGSDWVLSCPAGGFPPFDAEPYPRSAYWAKREALAITVPV